MSELTLKRCSSPLPHRAYREFLLHLSPCGDTKASALRHLLEKWGRRPAGETPVGDRERRSLPTAQPEDAQPSLTLCPGCS